MSVHHLCDMDYSHKAIVPGDFFYPRRDEIYIVTVSLLFMTIPPCVLFSTLWYFGDKND